MVIILSGNFRKSSIVSCEASKFIEHLVTRIDACLPADGIQYIYVSSFQYCGYRQGRIKLFGAPRQWKHFRPLFQAVFLSGGCITPQTVKHHASQSQDRNNKYFILYIEFCINNKI